MAVRLSHLPRLFSAPSSTRDARQQTPHETRRDTRRDTPRLPNDYRISDYDEQAPARPGQTPGFPLPPSYEIGAPVRHRHPLTVPTPETRYAPPRTPRAGLAPLAEYLARRLHDAEKVYGDACRALPAVNWGELSLEAQHRYRFLGSVLAPFVLHFMQHPEHVTIPPAVIGGDMNLRSMLDAALGLRLASAFVVVSEGVSDRGMSWGDTVSLAGAVDEPLREA